MRSVISVILLILMKFTTSFSVKDNIYKENCANLQSVLIVCVKFPIDTGSAWEL